jgi:pimeloyl-ACP methyl ester carboxylesterase
MFSPGTDPVAVEAFGAAVRAFHPTGFRAMARASAEDLRDVLPRIDVPTLLLYGAEDVRAPLSVARDLEASIRPSTLVVLPDTGHVANIEAPRRSTTRSGRSSSGRVRRRLRPPLGPPRRRLPPLHDVDPLPGHLVPPELE